MADRLWYPTVEDVVAIHEEIVSESAETSPGLQNRGDIEFALDYVEQGNFGTVPESIHESAFHLLRLLVANHPFVDGNKRTALNTVTVFYFFNGYRLTYGGQIRDILKRFGTDEATVDERHVIEYLQTNTEEIDLEAEVSKWRGDLVRNGVDKLTDEGDPKD